MLLFKKSKYLIKELNATINAFNSKATTEVDNEDYTLIREKVNTKIKVFLCSPLLNSVSKLYQMRITAVSKLKKTAKNAVIS